MENGAKLVSTTFDQDGKVGQSVGLTKREHLAFMTLQGLLAGGYEKDYKAIEQRASHAAHTALMYTDELLSLLEPSIPKA